MRILFACTDADIGGAERLLLTLAHNKHHEDTVGLVVLMRRGSLSDQLDSAFDTITYLGFPPSSRNLPGMVRSLQRVVDDFRPDVISSHLFHADLVVALARTRVPKTTTIHTQGFGSGDHPMTKAIARAVGALSFRFAAVIPASSSPAMERFIRQLRYRHLSDPITNAAEIGSAPIFDSRQRTFVSVARNHPVKGHKLLIEAFARLAGDFPDWNLACYGPGVTMDDPAMQDAVAAADAIELGNAGRLKLLGPISGPNVAFAHAGALVISSTYGEAFPVIGAEAAGAGVPVITTDVGSCSEFADDKQFVAEPGNVDSLEAAMRQYATLSDEERQNLSDLARTRAEARYSPQRTVAAYRNVFSEVIREAR